MEVTICELEVITLKSPNGGEYWEKWNCLENSSPSKHLMHCNDQSLSLREHESSATN